MKFIILAILLPASANAAYILNPYTNQKDYYQTAVEQNYNAVSATVTLQGNTFNGSNQLVKTGVTGKFPASVLPTDGYSSTYVNVGEAIPGSVVDLSTVTTALAGKQATGNYITELIGNVTASGPGSVTATIVSVPQSAVNLSTVTTALASKANTADVIPSTATGTYALSTTGRAALATSADNATTVTNGAYVNASNYFTGINQFTLNTTISNKLYVDEIQLSSAVPSIKAYDGASIKNILMYPGVEINSSPGYAYNWILASTDSLKMKYYDAGPDVGQYFKYDKYGLVTSSGIRAGASRVDGSGGVNVIGSDGRIPALTSTYFADLDGSAITGITDNTKVARAGDSMTGQLTVGSSVTITNPTSGIYDLTMQAGHSQNIKLNNISGTASISKLGGVDFQQSGTGKSQITAYGDSNASYPKGLLIGASATSDGANIRLMGTSSLNPDVFVSSWSSVGINTASPNSAYSLDVNGKINATGIYKNGIEISGGSGGDNLGSHIATQTIVAPYGISASTFAANSITSSNAIVTSSDVVAHAYYGDGSHLTGISGAGDVYKASTQTFTGSNTFTGSVTVSSLTVTTGATLPSSIRQSSLPSFLPKAWGVIIGTGTVVMAAGGNVASVSHPSTGNYLVTLSTAMPDTYYSVSGVCDQDNALSSNMVDFISHTVNSSSFQIRCHAINGSSTYDSVYVQFILIR